MKFQAKEDLKLVSASAHIDFAAAKKIHLAVEGGASITIDGGITVQCPGTITVHASRKSFSGPTSLSYPLDQWASTDFSLPCAAAAGNLGSAFVRLSCSARRTLITNRSSIRRMRWRNGSSHGRANLARRCICLPICHGLDDASQAALASLTAAATGVVNYTAISKASNWPRAVRGCLLYVTTPFFAGAEMAMLTLTGSASCLAGLNLPISLRTSKRCAKCSCRTTRWALFRFQDTNVTCALFSLLATAQADVLLGPLTAWVTPDACGHLHVIRRKRRTPRVATLRFDRPTFEALESRLFVHTVAAQVRDSRPCPRTLHPARRNACSMAKKIERARELGLIQRSDISLFCVLGSAIAESASRSARSPFGEVKPRFPAITVIFRSAGPSMPCRPPHGRTGTRGWNAGANFERVGRSPAQRQTQ